MEKVTTDTFNDMITKSNQKLVILDFWAEWCGPCKMLNPTLENLSNERDDIVIGKINVDEEPSLAAEYSIRSIPTILFLKDGQIINKQIGVLSHSDFENIIDTL